MCFSNVPVVVLLQSLLSTHIKQPNSTTDYRHLAEKMSTKDFGRERVLWERCGSPVDSWEMYCDCMQHGDA